MKALEAYAGIIKLVLGVVIIAALWYGFHLFVDAQKEKGREEIRKEYAAKLVEAKEASAKVEGVLREQLNLANQNANSREQIIRNLASSSGASSVGLRDALNSMRDGAASASSETLVNSTRTLSTLLADCQGRYRELAEKADRHASDAKTLSEAWPVIPAKP